MFDAPRDMVWKAVTTPEMVKRWWGPKGFTAPVIKIDLRVGGKYLYAMRSPEGKDFWSAGVFRKIIPPGGIVLEDSFSDAEGNVVPASYYGMTGEWPLAMQVTMTFEEQKGRTKLTLLYNGTPPDEMIGPMTQGWNESLDKLAAVLEEEKTSRAKTTLVAEPGKQEVSMIRIFNAPRERVFKALTDPKLTSRWWAPRRFTIVMDKMDVKPGGVWRVLHRDASGNEFWFHGVYHDVSPTRIVSTFEFEGMPGHVVLGIQTLEDVGGRTKLTAKSIFESVEDRDGMLNSGMEDGGRETWDRLAELVENPQ
jgi:uncharacterized protein YndB with AHSA1/START domain